MTSLFHFEEKIHKKNLSRAETIPLMFLRLLCHVLEHLSFSDEPYHERRWVCEATFTIEKWQFVPRAPSLPAYPSSEVDPHINPPQVQMPPATPTQEPHITTSASPTSDLVPATSVPTTHSSPLAPIVPASPSSSSPPLASINITAPYFLAIMVAVNNFAFTSQSFDAA